MRFLPAVAAISLLLLAPSAEAKGKSKSKHKKPAVVEHVHPFEDVPLAKLQVADTRGPQAVIENKDGEVVLVRAGDRLAQEGFEVIKVSRGCVQLKNADAEITLCADVPEVPRT